LDENKKMKKWYEETYNESGELISKKEWEKDF
jgi:hypothetical protein